MESTAIVYEITGVVQKVCWENLHNVLQEVLIYIKDDYRSPTASINFITAHDGFTLHDLVSYNEKHNQANGENNNDGESHNRSWNCGEEGPTDDPDNT